MSILLSSFPAAALCAALASVAPTNDVPSADDQWPAWRGPNGDGVAVATTAPIEWSEEKNIKWKVGLPGLGISTPIVWGDKLYVTTAVETDRMPEGADAPKEEDAAPEPPQEGRRGRGERGGRGGGRGGRGGQAKPQKFHEFRVLCVDRKDGSVVWSSKVADAVPHEAGHSTNSQASASPITDGEHIWAFFGSRGLHCIDMQGKLKWSKELGQMQTRNGFGEGASPALHGDTLVVQWDHEGDDFIAAFDKTTGEEKWRQERDEATTWSTPLIVEVAGKAQVITTATGASRAYDLETGKPLWWLGGMTTNCIPTPIVKDGVAYLMSGYRGSALQAVRLEGAKGNLEDSKNLLWSYDKNTPYVPSGVLTGGNLYFLRVMSGRLTCVGADTGKVHYDAESLGSIRSVYASLTAVGDHVYCVSREGETVVVKAGDTFDQAAVNVLDDEFDASPIAVDGELYLRGRANLYCITQAAD